MSNMLLKRENCNTFGCPYINGVPLSVGAKGSAQVYASKVLSARGSPVKHDPYVPHANLGNQNYINCTALNPTSLVPGARDVDTHFNIKENLNSVPGSLSICPQVAFALNCQKNKSPSLSTSSEKCEGEIVRLPPCKVSEYSKKCVHGKLQRRQRSSCMRNDTSAAEIRTGSQTNSLQNRPQFDKTRQTMEKITEYEQPTDVQIKENEWHHEDSDKYVEVPSSSFIRIDGIDGSEADCGDFAWSRETDGYCIIRNNGQEISARQQRSSRTQNAQTRDEERHECSGSYVKVRSNEFVKTGKLEHNETDHYSFPWSSKTDNYCIIRSDGQELSGQRPRSSRTQNVQIKDGEGYHECSDDYVKVYADGLDDKNNSKPNCSRRANRCCITRDCGQETVDSYSRSTTIISQDGLKSGVHCRRIDTKWYEVLLSASPAKLEKLLDTEKTYTNNLTLELFGKWLHSRSYAIMHNTAYLMAPDTLDHLKSIPESSALELIDSCYFTPLDRKLGEGSYGEVVLAIKNGQECAIKFSSCASQAAVLRYGYNTLMLLENHFVNRFEAFGAVRHFLRPIEYCEGIIIRDHSSSSSFRPVAALIVEALKNSISLTRLRCFVEDTSINICWHFEVFHRISDIVLQMAEAHLQIASARIYPSDSAYQNWLLVPSLKAGVTSNSGLLSDFFKYQFRVVAIDLDNAVPWGFHRPCQAKLISTFPWVSSAQAMAWLISPVAKSIRDKTFPKPRPNLLNMSSGKLVKLILRICREESSIWQRNWIEDPEGHHENNSGTRRGIFINFPSQDVFKRLAKKLKEDRVNDSSEKSASEPYDGLSSAAVTSTGQNPSSGDALTPEIQNDHNIKECMCDKEEPDYVAKQLGVYIGASTNVQLFALCVCPLLGGRSILDWAIHTPEWQMLELPSLKGIKCSGLTVIVSALIMCRMESSNTTPLKKEGESLALKKILGIPNYTRLPIISKLLLLPRLKPIDLCPSETRFPPRCLNEAERLRNVLARCLDPDPAANFPTITSAVRAVSIAITKLNAAYVQGWP